MLVHYIGLDRKIGESHKMNTALVLAGGTGTRYTQAVYTSKWQNGYRLLS